MSISNESSITATDVRTWFKALEIGNAATFIDEIIDENVDWVSFCPGDGPLGKTTPISGSFKDRDAYVNGSVMPLEVLFVEPAKFTVVDVFVQPSAFNDPAERNLTKAIIEMKVDAVVKKTGKEWDNYWCLVAHIDNETKKIVKGRFFGDTAAVNLAMES